VNFNVKERKRAARRIERRLRKEYGEPRKKNVEDPLDILIRTILSQNTSDANSGRAFDGLKERFRDWDAARRASVRQLEQAIRVGGLAKIKSRRIKRILSQIHDDYGKMSLAPLCGMGSEEAATALLAFDGVGPKTVNCVLLFGFGMNVFPVDTHILRISKRLDLIPQGATLERAHTLWAEFLPDGLAYSLHLNLIMHGRRICHARTPKCESCCLGQICKWHKGGASGIMKP